MLRIVKLTFRKSYPQFSPQIQLYKTRDEFQPIYEEILDVGFDDYSDLSQEDRNIFNVTPLVDLRPLNHYQESDANYNEDSLKDLKAIGSIKATRLMKLLTDLFPEGKPPGNKDARLLSMAIWDKHQEDRKDEEFSELVDELEVALLEYADKIF